MSLKMRTPAAAKYLLKSVSWLNKSRLDGSGPTYMRLGSTIIYDSADLGAWMDARRVAANDNVRARAAA